MRERGREGWWRVEGQGEGKREGKGRIEGGRERGMERVKVKEGGRDGGKSHIHYGMLTSTLSMVLSFSFN